MSIADRLAESKMSSVKRCRVRQIVYKLEDEKDREALAAALVDPSWSSEVITKILKAEGQAISSTAIGRHRTGQCCCEEKPEDTEI